MWSLILPLPTILSFKFNILKIIICNHWDTSKISISFQLLLQTLIQILKKKKKIEVVLSHHSFTVSHNPPVLAFLFFSLDPVFRNSLFPSLFLSHILQAFGTANHSLFSSTFFFLASLIISPPFSPASLAILSLSVFQVPLLSSISKCCPAAGHYPNAHSEGWVLFLLVS